MPGGLTLAIDIGASNIKAGVVDARGRLAGHRRKVETPRGSVSRLVDAMAAVARELPPVSRATVGFPGLVHEGVVWSAPNLGNDAFSRAPLAALLRRRLRRPVLVVNDAVMHGFGAVRGRGVEIMLTFGSGLGTAVFLDGAPSALLQLLPITAPSAGILANLGDEGLERLGQREWSRRVHALLRELRVLVPWRRLYLGGGNADRIGGRLPRGARIVRNAIAMRGAAFAWRRTAARS